MKNKKSILSVIIVLAMLLSLAACGQTPESGSASGSTNSGTSPEGGEGSLVIADAIQTFAEDGATYSDLSIDAMVNDYNNATIYQDDFLFGDERFDAPELAARGDYGVGVRAVTVADPEAEEGYEDYLLDIYYPASIPDGAQELAWVDSWYGNSIGDELRPSSTYPITVRALRDAEPSNEGMPEGGFPIILYSHGSTGSAAHYTNYITNLASKGYIVVGVNHTGNSRNTATLQGAGGMRYEDLTFVLDNIENAVKTEGSFLYNLGDITNCGVSGRSMGGVGTLYMAGFDAVEGMADPRVRAGVAVAPAAGYAWSGGHVSEEEENLHTALANITVPTLTITGTHDDTIPYAVQKYNFNYMAGNEAYQLIFEGGQHEVNTDPYAYRMSSDDLAILHTLDEINYYTPPEDASEEMLNAWSLWREYTFFVEVMWDHTRLNNVIQHYATAFFDKELKNDDSMEEYLNVSYPISSTVYAEGSEYEPWKGLTGENNDGLELYNNGVEYVELPVYDHSIDVSYTDMNMAAFQAEVTTVEYDVTAGGEYFTSQEGWVTPMEYSSEFVYGDTRTSSPLLAYAGEYAVGTRRVNISDTELQLWYPTDSTATADAMYWDSYGEQNYAFAGGAIQNADVMTSSSAYPLVVLSDESGSLVSMTYLAENLASKGYAVASVGSQDIPAAVTAMAAMDDGATLTPSAIAFDSVTLIGNWAQGNTVLQLAADKAVEGLAAVIAIAPVLEDGDEVMMVEDVPVMLLAGTGDDNTSLASIQNTLEGMDTTDRYLLSYSLAGSSVGLNPVPWFAGEEYMPEFEDRYESLWNQVHLNDFNKHFITAFLGLYIQGDDSMVAYMQPEEPIYDRLPQWLNNWEGIFPYAISGVELHYRAQGESGIDNLEVAIEGDTATLEFDAAAGAEAVEIWLSYNNGFTWTMSEQDPVLDETSTSASVALTMPAFLSSVEVQFRVEATGGANNGYSPVVTAMYSK